MGVLDRLILRDDQWERMSAHIIGDARTRGSSMGAVPAIVAVVSLTATAIFAGDIPGALLRIPGTPASAAYVDEAYALTRAGKPEVGLSMTLSASVIGGLVGTCVLIFSAPLLARLALGFSSPEYFWLALLGLSCASFSRFASAPSD